MSYLQDNQSVGSEYSEYTVEDSEQDGDEGPTHVAHLPQALHASDCDDAEYNHDPSSLVLDAHATPKTNRSPQDSSATSSDMKRILRIQNKRIQMLLQSNKDKEERLQHLEQEVQRQKVQHKEGIYWLQLQLDTAQREKNAAEERMAELQADLQEMVKMKPKDDAPKNDDDGDAEDNELRQKLQTYETSLLVMENQLDMVRKSYGEIVKTLKEEIVDLQEERSRMEVDLLNQLSTLDSRKKQAELEYELRLNEKDEMIELMQMNSRAKIPPLADVRHLEKEIEQLQTLKEQAEELAQKERAEADEVIYWLKEDKAKLERQLETSKDDLSLLRSEINSKNALDVLERVTQERVEINKSLARLTSVWEMADTSVTSLEEAIERLRPKGNAKAGGDRERMLSILESASLLHGQIKVSLLLIEVKLRNQLQCLKSDKLTNTGDVAPRDEGLTSTMEEIRMDALTALSQVETALSNQMKLLKESALREAAETKGELRERGRKLEEMKEEYRRLEAEVGQLKDSNQGSDCFAPAWSSQGEHSDDKKENVQTIAISTPVMNQLHEEVMRIVGRIQEKNKIIALLREDLEEHKTREENLRKELKRTLRANHATQNVAKNSPRTPTKMYSPSDISKSKTKKLSPAEKKQLLSSPLTLTSPTRTPIKTPAKVKDAVSARYGPGKSPVSANSGLYTPNSSIKPLQPSPREISRPRHSSANPSWVPNDAGVVNTE
ncbi:hypothetical protein IV203_035703 [Nitzschia inconspicua]|uniref:Uncharacterized protein n=1 Tax=Nitzschia inconspicua TaxID=303405 RepID=A0A9K3LDX7_9STRA|nr:hypothetical protein IV203_035703 [Nitzschia inconspicua]